MAKTNNLTDFLTGLADKLRAKLGGTALINPQSFESKIDEVYQKGYDSAPQGVDTSDATAAADDVQNGKTFYAGGVKKTGSLNVTAGLIDSAVTVVDEPRNNRIYAQNAGISQKAIYNKNTKTKLLIPYEKAISAIGLTADKIVSGNTILGVAGTAQTGVDTSDATATAADVLQGKIFYGADGEGKKGTMPQKTSVNGLYDVYIQGQIPRVAFKITENGYVTSNSSTVVLAANLFNGISLTADKILKGKKVLYLDGTATSDATATAADILSGKTAYVNGVKLTGTAATGVDVSDTTATAADVVSSKVFYRADGTKQTGEVYVMDRLAGRITNDGGTISGGSVTDDSNGTIGFYSDPYGFPLYLKGTGGFSVDAPYSVVAQAIGLTGDKIVSGNTILGVNGTATTGVDTSDATATAADILSGKTAYVNGVKLTGTAPQVECGSFTPTATTDVEGYTINVNKQPQQLIIYLNPTNETYQSYRLIYILDWNVNKGFITYSSTTKKVTLSDLAVYSNGVVTLSDVDGVRDTRYFYKDCEYHYIIKY